MAQVQLLERRQTFVAIERGDLVVCQVELLQLRHALEGRHVFEFVVNALEDFQVGVARPSLIDLLQLVEGDVEVLELGALERWQLRELVTRDVEVAQVKAKFF